jgi:hypothetical protein
MTVADLLAQIARRDNSRAEATLQADIRQLILTEWFPKKGLLGTRHRPPGS